MLAEYVTVANPSVAGQKVAIFAVMFFVFFYGLFVDAASFIYSSEIYPTNIRSRGMALSTMTYFVACIVSPQYTHSGFVADHVQQTYVTPGATAVADIGWRYFVLFACLTVVSIVVIYFFYPETSKRSLEELAVHFGETVVRDEGAKNDTNETSEKDGSTAEHQERTL